MINKIIFITGNKQKADTVQKFLNIEVEPQSIELTEIQSLSAEEVIDHKIKEAFAKVKKTVLVQDASLVFKSLGKLPGPYIKWFIQEIGLEGLCRLLDSQKNRDAVAEVAFGVYDGKELKTIVHRVEGTIVESPRGTNGFGWDVIFQPKGFDKTYAEMTDEELRKDYILVNSLKKLGTFLNHEYQ